VLRSAGRATVRWNSGTEQNVSAVIEAVQKAGLHGKGNPGRTSTCLHKPNPSNWQINLCSASHYRRVDALASGVFGSA